MRATPTSLTIVTAANQLFWRSLYQFLLSARRRRLHRTHKFIAYDLGLDADTLAFLERRFGWCEFRGFGLENYPPHAKERRSFAWKPLVICDAMATGDGYFLWLDSATLFKTSDLGEVVCALEHGEFYYLKGQTALSKSCDPATLLAMSFPKEFYHKPERAGGVVGIDAGNPVIRRLIAEWREHALIEAHIMPRSGVRHHYDQSLLSILAYKYEAAGDLILSEGEIDISSYQPVRWMTSRNKVRPTMPLWADPFVRAYYLLYKTIDCMLWKWKHWRDTRVHGWHRYLKEHFTVYLCRNGDGSLVRVKAPRLSYYADPFLLTHEGRNWLLVEEFQYPLCLGRLCAVPLDDALRAGAPVPILPLDCHASFPLPFEHAGKLYLLPETHESASIDLYVCERFPDRWRLARRLIYGIDAVDAVPLFHEGHWWIITSALDGDDALGRSLAVYFSDDLLTGEWRAHPINAARLSATLPFSSHRNAGPIVREGDLLLRPTQDNLRYYGDGVQIMRILTLTPEEYREEPYEGDHVFARIARKFSPHHISSVGALSAFDIRDRVGFASHVPFFRRWAVKPDARVLALAGTREVALAALGRRA